MDLPAEIDAVLASLDRLEETGVADHVAVFTDAHDTLRRILARAGEPAPTTAVAAD